MFDLDETLDRSAARGRIAHAAIATLAAKTRRPTQAEVQHHVDAALERFAPIEARAHRQNLRGVIHRYFTRGLPPRRFVFGGAEFDLGIGRADLVWFDIDGFVLADEVKTGDPRTLLLSSTTKQLDRYRTACREAWGTAFLGLRLLCLTDPAASRFIDPSGATSLLSASPYLEVVC